MNWELFISHAHEDKIEVAEPLAHRFKDLGLKVWYDDFTLKLGDSLRQRIDHGLANSKYGLVILSPSFFENHWPQQELDGLVAREAGENDKKILPVWHQVDHQDVARFSPMLAGRLGVKTAGGLETVIKQVLAVVRPKFNSDKSPPTYSHSLRPEGVTLLKEAASTPSGRFIGMSNMEGFMVQAGDFVFQDLTNPRQTARYKAAIKQLLDEDFITEITDGLYELTDTGYEFVDRITSI
jgi:hypothetical protein